MWRNGSANALHALGCRFESDHLHQQHQVGAVLSVPTFSLSLCFLAGNLNKARYICYKRYRIREPYLRTNEQDGIDDVADKGDRTHTAHGDLFRYQESSDESDK